MRCGTAFLVSIILLAGLEPRFAAGVPAMECATALAVREKAAVAIGRDLKPGLAGEAGSNLQLLDPALSLPSDARLQVASVRVGYSPGTWLLRLECSSRRECLPFHVLLHAPDVNLLDGFTGNSASHVSGKGRLRPALARPKQLRSPVARSGDRVLLVEELSGMRLKVSAVCLESGGLGDEIRVRNVATRRVVLATVAGKDLVRVENGR